VSSRLKVSDRSLDNRIRLLVLQGELDRATAPGLAARLSCAWPRHGSGVIVDLTQVTSLDASGITLLHNSQLRFAGAGGRLAVVSEDLCGPRGVAATRWGPTLDVFPSRTQAVAAVARCSMLVRPTAVRSLLDVPSG